MQSLKIMIVDDDQTTLEVTAAVLESHGHQVVKRDSALGTTMAILREQPAVVLLDVHMPGLSGDRLAELVTPRKGKPSPMVILHSGSNRKQLELLAARCGAAGIIEKTGDPLDFIRAFERVVARSRGSRQSGDTDSTR
jgi:CheY-like chemotaxis protein